MGEVQCEIALGRLGIVEDEIPVRSRPIVGLQRVAGQKGFDKFPVFPSLPFDLDRFSGGMEVERTCAHLRGFSPS